jgi:hypothetical protein
MEPCDLVEQWDNLTAQERLDEMEALINEHLESMGYAPVSTEINNLDNANADYGKENNLVRFDADYIENSSADKVIRTAYHEMAHAMEYQDGNYDALSDTERQQYNDDYIVEEGSMDFAENDFHPDIAAFAEYMANETLNECQSQDPAASDIYGSGRDLPIEIEMGEPIIRDEMPDGDQDIADDGDFEFEIDFDNAVFSSGG